MHYVKCVKDNGTTHKFIEGGAILNYLADTVGEIPGQDGND